MNPGGWSFLWDRLLADGEVEESTCKRPEKHTPSSVLFDWWTWQREPSVEGCEQVLQVINENISFY